MRINLVEKFGLYEKLTNLSKNLSEHEESQVICNKAIHDLKSDFNTKKVTLYVEQLKKYNWITEISNFLEELDKFVVENKYGIELETISEKLKGISTYEPLVESIKKLVPLSESKIKSSLPELSKFKYEPHIKRLVESFEQSELKVQTKENAKITDGIVTPVMQLEEGFVFSTNSGVHVISNDLKKIDTYYGGVDNKFRTSQNALKLFKYKGNNIFEARLPKAIIKVEAGEQIKMTINESEIKNKEQLTKTLKNSGIIQYNDIATRSLIEFMYENANSFVEVDFVKSVETVNENFEIFKLANNEVVISKFDNKKREFVLESLDIEDVDYLKESLDKKYKLNLDLVLEGLCINTDSLQFKKLVENINILDVKDMTKTKELYNKLEEATAKYNTLNVENRANVEVEFSKLLEMQTILNKPEVLFLVETKNALVEKLDESEELTESLNMLNEELTSILK